MTQTNTRSPSSPSHQPGSPGTPPTMALRTYRFLRLGVVAVIVLLALSILRESFEADPDCLQASISAYYYTPVQSVFVGALLVLGFTMIVLWGRTPAEDAFFNLAGMLAPVVAFVPTSDSDKCLLVDPTGSSKVSDAEKEAVLDASHAAIDNNMYAYLVALGFVLVALLVIGVLAQTGRRWTWLVETPLAFWGPWLAAAALWVFGLVKFNEPGRVWLYADAHMWSAVVMFVFIVAAVVAVGHDKHRDRPELDEGPEPAWARIYWTLAAVMSVGAVVIFLGHDRLGIDHLADHWVFWLEAWMIGGVLVFWLLQTWDRWHDGAPPRTDAEVVQRRTLAAQRRTEQGVPHGGEPISPRTQGGR